MKPMDFDYLDELVRQETTPPLASSSLFNDGNDMSLLGALIWIVREDRKLSHDAFAEQCKISVDEVKNIENDAAYTPNDEILHAISQFLKINNRILHDITRLVNVEEPIYEQQFDNTHICSPRARM
jgi:transcriptional regulator with XRE-family HTH domain